MRLVKQLSLILLISVALNLLLGGVLATRLFLPDRSYRHERQDAPAIFFNRRAAQASLSEESQRIVQEIWRKRRAELGENVRKSRELRRQLRDLLLADDVDQAKLTDVESQLHELGIDSRQALRGVLGEIAAALPPDERRKYFDAGFGPRHRRHVRSRGP